MRPTAKLLLTISILSATYRLSYAQPAPPLSKNNSTLVNVLDLHGNPIRDLAKTNFRLRVDGRQVEILSATYSVAPRRIVVLLDMSGSMAPETDSNKWGIAREAVGDLLAETPPDVPIAMLTFSGHVRDVFDFSRGRTAITNWLQQDPSRQVRTQIRGGTALLDAILEALKILQPFEPGNAIYAITDGGDNASRLSVRKAREMFLKSGVRLFAFLFAEATFGSEEDSKHSFLEMIADSGGFAFGVVGRQSPGDTPWNFAYRYDQRSRDRISAYTKALNVQVHGFWTLEFATPSSKKSCKVKLEVIDTQGKARKDVAFTYAARLPAKE